MLEFAISAIAPSPRRNSDTLRWARSAHCAADPFPVRPSDFTKGRQNVSITRLNHAVLYVRDLPRSVAFYRDVLGFRQVDMTPEGFDGAAFLQAAGSSNDHDLGLFQLGANAGPSGAGRSTVGVPSTVLTASSRNTGTSSQ